MYITDCVSCVGGDYMVSDSVKRIHKAKGIKQSYLAEVLGISSMSYSRLERGESKLDVDRLQVIAKALEVPVAAFFEEIIE